MVEAVKVNVGTVNIHIVKNTFKVVVSVSIQYFIVHLTVFVQPVF